MYDKERLKIIFSKTDGRCHLCNKRLAFRNHGQLGRRGAWEVEHSNPRANGGHDHLNNLFPAHILCNREKGTVTTRTARAWHGRTHAPLSTEKVVDQRLWSAVGGGVLGFVAGCIFMPEIALVRVGALLIGACAGYNQDPNS